MEESEQTPLSQEAQVLRPVRQVTEDVLSVCGSLHIARGTNRLNKLGRKPSSVAGLELDNLEAEMDEEQFQVHPG